MKKFKRHNIVYTVTGITPNQIYYEDKFYNKSGSISRDKFSRLLAKDEIKIVET